MSRIIVALDFADAAQALAFVDRVSPLLCRLKVGKELFTAAGPQLVEQLVRRGFAVFLDLKFHDIPNTVAQACKAAARLGAWMLNVHASGGRAMLMAAREALQDSPQRPRLIAVTVLTSLAAADLREVGMDDDPQAAVLRLARLARDCRLDGVVCSAQEATALRRECGEEFLLVTPGIRPTSQMGSDDQKRVMTPRAALESGASYLVIGRPITHARDPLAALEAIEREITATGLASAS